MIGVIMIFKIYEKMHVRLVLYLCIADFLHGVGASLSLGFVNHVPQTGEGLCTMQAILTQVGDVTSGFMSLFIGFFVWANVHGFNYSWVENPGKKFEIIALIFSWGISIFFIVIGWIRYSVTGFQFFTPVGFRSWCWISEIYPTERITLLWVWIFTINITLFILYIHIMKTLYRKKIYDLKKTEENYKKQKKLAKIMIGFPVVFFFCICTIRIGESRFLRLFG
jgi:hypothetical protein